MAVTDASPRVAGFDANNVWHDPGNGQFAKPGWSTAKAVALSLIHSLADLARDNPDGIDTQAKGGLESVGIPDGSRVKARWLSDTHATVTDPTGRQRRVPWAMLAEVSPSESSQHTEHGLRDLVPPPPAPSAPVAGNGLHGNHTTGESSPEPSEPEVVGFEVGQFIEPSETTALAANARFKVWWTEIGDDTAVTEYRRSTNGRFFDVDTPFDEIGEDPDGFADYIGGRAVEIVHVGGPRFEPTAERVQTVLDGMAVDSPANGVGNWLFYMSADPNNPTREDVDRSVTEIAERARSHNAFDPVRSVMFTTARDGRPIVQYSSESVEEFGESIRHPSAYPAVDRPFVIVPVDSPDYVRLAQAAGQWETVDEFRDAETAFLSGAVPNIPRYNEKLRWGADRMKERSDRLIDEVFGASDTVAFSYDPATGDFTPNPDGDITLSRSEPAWMYARHRDGAIRVRLENQTKNRVLGLSVDFSIVDDTSLPYETRVAALAEQRRVLVAMMPGGASNYATWFPDQQYTETGSVRMPVRRMESLEPVDREALESLQRVSDLGERVAALIGEVAEQTPPVSYAVPLHESARIVELLADAANVDERTLGDQHEAYEQTMWTIRQAAEAVAQVADMRVNPETGATTVTLMSPVMKDTRTSIVLTPEGRVMASHIAAGVPVTSTEVWFHPDTTGPIQTAVREAQAIHDQARPAPGAAAMTSRLVAHRKVLTDLGIDMTTDESMRLIGGGELSTVAADEPRGVTLRAGLAVYPRSWTSTLADHVVAVSTVEPAGGGSNLTKDQDIDLRLPDVAAAPWLADVAGHEFGHSFQKTIPAVNQAEYWHMLSRMRPGESPVTHQFGAHAVSVVEDEWADSYSGRLYDEGITSTDSMEVFTTGVQTIYDTGHRPASQFDADPRLRNFTIGLLAAIEPEESGYRIPRDQMSVTQLLGAAYTVHDVTALLRSGALTDRQRADLREILDGMV